MSFLRCFTLNGSGRLILYRVKPLSVYSASLIFLSEWQKNDPEKSYYTLRTIQKYLHTFVYFFLFGKRHHIFSCKRNYIKTYSRYDFCIHVWMNDNKLQATPGSVLQSPVCVTLNNSECITWCSGAPGDSNSFSRALIISAVENAPQERRDNRTRSVPSCNHARCWYIHMPSCDNLPLRLLYKFCCFVCKLKWQFSIGLPFIKHFFLLYITDVE